MPISLNQFFFFHLNTALPFPLQDLVQRLRSHTPSSVSSTPSEVTAIPCELFGNTLRTFRQYLASPVLEKSRFFLLQQNFSSLVRGDLWDAYSSFGRLGQNPAWANIAARAYACVKPVARGQAH